MVKLDFEKVPSFKSFKSSFLISKLDHFSIYNEALLMRNCKCCIKMLYYKAPIQAYYSHYFLNNGCSAMLASYITTKLFIACNKLNCVPLN